MEESEYLRYLAGRCRYLAREINDQTDPVAKDLLQLSDAFDERAAAREAVREHRDAAN